MKICCPSMRNILIFLNALNSRYIRNWSLYTINTIQMNIINSYYMLVKYYQNIIDANRKIPFERESVKPSHQTLASEVQSLEMTEVKYRWHLISLCLCILCFQTEHLGKWRFIMHFWSTVNMITYHLFIGLFLKVYLVVFLMKIINFLMKIKIWMEMDSLEQQISNMHWNYWPKMSWIWMKYNQYGRRYETRIYKHLFEVICLEL